MTSVTQYETTPEWQSYVDIQNDVMPFLQFTTGLSVPQTVEQQLRETVDMACTWVQNYLGRPIAPTEFKRLFSGWSSFNGSHICLPYYPVLEVKEVVETWGLSGQHRLEEQTPENQASPEAYQVDPLSGILVRVFQGLVQRPFFPGSRNISVTWIAGYNPVPADIKRATLILVAHYWRNEMQASRNAPRPQGEYDPDNPSQGLFAAVPHRVEALLEPYTQQGIG